MQITKLEKETVINYNDAEQTASVYTFNRALQRKLDKLAQEFPDCVRLARKFPGGAVEYELPKKLVAIRKPRKSPGNKRGKTADLPLLQKEVQPQ